MFLEESLTIRIPCDDVERSQHAYAEFSRLVREALEVEIVRRKLPKPARVTGTDKGKRPEPFDAESLRCVYEHEYIFHYSEQGPDTPTEIYLTQMVHEIYDGLSRKDTQTT